MVVDWDSKEFNDKLLATYKVTEDPLQCGWILPDGRMLDFVSGANDQYVFAHFSIEWVTGVPRDECIDHFNRAGAIRHTHSQRAVSIMKAPPEPQLKSLASLLRMHYKDDNWISGRTQLLMRDGERESFEHYPLGANPAYIIDDVRKFFRP